MLDMGAEGACEALAVTAIGVDSANDGCGSLVRLRAR